MKNVLISVFIIGGLSFLNDFTSFQFTVLLYLFWIGLNVSDIARKMDK